ncbi:hypothetical protein H4Q26_003491 [Puccinia striiformis f. sp. tritici PST-130]|nr:hypothetical protein H4Q26_003491 [Puccinia striiformis f. sp. tritici PST-130]
MAQHHVNQASYEDSGTHQVVSPPHASSPLPLPKESLKPILLDLPISQLGNIKIPHKSNPFVLIEYHVDRPSYSFSLVLSTSAASFGPNSVAACFQTNPTVIASKDTPQDAKVSRKLNSMTAAATALVSRSDRSRRNYETFHCFSPRNSRNVLVTFLHAFMKFLVLLAHVVTESPRENPGSN